MKIIVFLSMILSQSYGLKILLYQTLLGRSHIQFSGALVDSLVERGHVIDKLIMEWNPSVISNGTTLARKVIRIQPLNGTSPWTRMFHIKNPLQPIKFRFTDEAYLETRKVFCESLLSQDSLLEELRRENYDVGLVSIYDSCGVGILHLIGVKSVNAFVATPMPDMLAWQLGIPMSPSYLTDTFNWDTKSKKFGFFERLSNTHYFTALMLSIDYVNDGEQRAFTRKIPTFPSLRSLIANLTYVFLNTNEVLDISRPVTAKVKYIGGIAMKKPKPLEKEFDRILSISPKGTVLFSFGSLAQTSILPLEVKLSILRAFAKFPEFTFIWKYDDIEKDRELFKNFSNVHLTEWLPQIDLLYDNRVKAFITHMGLNSYLETSHAGVPAIAIPLFGDQMQNAESAERAGYCMRLVKTDLHTEILIDALHKVLYDPRYAQKANEIATILSARPLTPHEILHHSLELSAKFPSLTSYLQLACVDLSAWTYFCMDVWLFLAGFSLFTLVFFYKFVKFSLSFVRTEKLKVH